MGQDLVQDYVLLDHTRFTVFKGSQANDQVSTRRSHVQSRNTLYYVYGILFDSITYRSRICEIIIVGMQTQDGCRQINRMVDLTEHATLSLDKMVEIAAAVLIHMHTTDPDTMASVWRTLLPKIRLFGTRVGLWLSMVWSTIWE